MDMAMIHTYLLVFIAGLECQWTLTWSNEQLESRLKKENSVT